MDFVLKVLSSYPDVELYWLMNGKGNFPKKESSQSKLPIETENAKTQLPSELPLDHKSEGKAIERIVIFYKDGTFKNFEQSQ